MCRLFHGTDRDFDRFDLSFAVQEDRHDNGALGIWFETRESVARSFGQWLITVDVDVDCWYEMSIAELSHHARIGDSIGYYVQLRAQLTAQGFQGVRLVELNGQSLQRIVLDLATITMVNRTEALIHEPLA